MAAVCVGDGVFPPKAKPFVESPAKPNPDLAVFKLLTSVQLVPSQDSVLAVRVSCPPAANAFVCVPSPPG